MNIFQKILFMKFRTNKKYVEVDKDTETEKCSVLENNTASLSSLLDNCTELVKTPGKVELHYGLDRDFIYVCRPGRKSYDYIFKIFKGHKRYAVAFRLSEEQTEEYDSDKFGEYEKMKELYDLCDGKLQQEIKLEQQRKEEQAKKNIAILDNQIKKYM